ncbi:MAG: DUF3141 domain-containing protein [Xanthobacteraceae bacterium]
MLNETVEDLIRRNETYVAGAGDVANQLHRLADTTARHLKTIATAHGQRAKSTMEAFARLQRELIGTGAQGIGEQFQSYIIDAWQRAVLTADTLRQRGNIFEAHEAAGAPPVLCYDYDVIVDGRDLKRPSNYMLLHLHPPKGVEVHDWKRPYMIIDPRAGHGAGIGGFKPDSEVGVALGGGHPVYFVAFRQHPERGQTLADVMRAEAEFVKMIVRLHPDSPRPAVVGNCQGGWAALLLAAANPEITGPLVINGAPVAAWSGERGKNPMRYSGGLLGGALPAALLSDLGAGQFDGANLVMNFEMMNPGRNWFRKYYDLFADVDRGREKFLEFEKWWGGFYFMNEEEMRWILENIFIGNRLSRGEARLEHGRTINLKAIRAPIIVFASIGDNITPPQQALNWIVDTYVDELEVKARGQRIIYMVHDKVGHLGIFVSSAIAKKEHAEMVSVLKTIETLAPGLYEMVIDEKEGEGLGERFRVSFQDRRMSDILALDGGRGDEVDFGAVARLSERAMEDYELFGRPIVRSLATPAMAAFMHAQHPLRLQRRMMSDHVPAAAAIRTVAAAVAADRRPVGPDNPFSRAETLVADAVEQWFDLARDVRDACYELTFLGIYGTPLMHWIGASHTFQRTRVDKDELRYLPEVEGTLANIARGGVPEAVIRMLIILADARGSVRRSRLERSAYTLNRAEPFASLGAERCARLIREQTLIVLFERDAAIEALVDLLPDMDARATAIGTVDYVVGGIEGMEPHTIEVMQMLRRVLGLPALSGDDSGPRAVAFERRAGNSLTEAV